VDPRVVTPRNLVQSLVLLLAGCNSFAPANAPPSGSRASAVRIEPDATIREAAIAGADWKHAVDVRIDLRDYGFAPPALRLRQGQAYRLTVFNSGGVAHYFNAPEFLGSIAARHVVVKDHVEVTAPSFSSFEVARRGGEFTVEFVPLARGTYRAYCHLAGDEHKGVQGKLIVE